MTPLVLASVRVNTVMLLRRLVFDHSAHGNNGSRVVNEARTPRTCSIEW